MNTFIIHAVEKITTNLKGIQAIVLSGSQQTESIVDLWSDTDMLIILSPGFRVDEQLFLQVVKEIGLVVGSESYQYSKQSIMYRSAIEFENSIQLFDVKICSYNEWAETESTKDQSYTVVYGQIDSGERIKTTVWEHSFNSYESNSTWFNYFMTIKKFARNDNLIGMHLLLDLVREFLVVEMIERDIKHTTNIHRFGYEEQLPDSIKLSQLDESDKKKLFDYIGRLAYEYDNKLLTNIMNYKSKYAQVDDYIEMTKQELFGK